MEVSRKRDHSSSVMSVGSAVPSRNCSAFCVSAPHPIDSIIFGVANGVNSACRKCLMFLFSINLSIVGPSVIGMYSSSNPSFGSGTSMDDIPPGQFILDGSSDIIFFVSLALLNIWAARFAPILGFIATKAASCSSSIIVCLFLCSFISVLQFVCASLSAIDVASISIGKIIRFQKLFLFYFFCTINSIPQTGQMYS
jgi:hypothetical protein